MKNYLQYNVNSPQWCKQFDSARISLALSAAGYIASTSAIRDRVLPLVIQKAGRVW
jgi:hypothetical protein